jgi:16S rRNA (guanine966-N2)-methyltransferase
MRITGGTHRGRILPAKVHDGVRPTSSRVREALFNILGNDLRDHSVLDATGGSGILAFEAASRGACPVLIQERDRRVVRTLRASVQALQLGERVRVICTDSVLRPTTEPFDLVLADPPYQQELEPWVLALTPLTGETLVLEHDVKKEAPRAPEGFELRTRRYGGTALSFYRRR